jgi:hypothetical protein
MPLKWDLLDEQRPWTANAERGWHYHKRADMVKSARTRFYYLALQAAIPKQDQIIVMAQPLLKSRRSRPDVAACYPTVKAAIDGIVDAGIIPNDTDNHLSAIIFLPAEIGKIEGLRVSIFPASQSIIKISK